MSLFAELKRRNVFKVAAVYVVTAWLVLQVADVILSNIGVPGWVFRVLLLLLAIGLPFAAIFAWAFELTPEGIRREADVDRTESVAPTNGSRLNIVLAALLAVAVGFILFDALSDRSDSADVVQDTASNSIAVLPLINMSAVPENEYFAGGVHEEILTNLSRIDGLRVVSRTTMLRYLNSDLGVGDIAREVDARYVVEGSVRRADNHVRITVQLIDAFNDAHLWARNYDRELTDIFATQSEVATVITNSLKLEIQPDSVVALDNMPTQSVRAYDLYIRARSIERSRAMTQSTLREQRKLLEDAIAEDPKFVEAWAYLKRVLDEIVIAILTGDSFGETQDGRDAVLADVVEARQFAMQQAIALDPDNIETVLAQASEDFLDPERRSADRKKFIDRALELDPENTEAWRHLGWYLRLLGDPDGAEQAFLKALELDPIHASNIFAAWSFYRAQGDEARTADFGARLARFAPDLEDDDILLELPFFAKMNNVVTLFIETADESVIDRIAELLEAERNRSDGTSAGPRFVIEINEANLMELRNQVEELADFTPAPLPEERVLDELLILLNWNYMVLAAQQQLDRSADAKITAARMLDYSELVPVEDHFWLIVSTLAAAIELGDKDTIAEFEAKVRDIQREGTAQTDPLLFHALSYLDMDEAVQLLLAQKTKHPNWIGTDLMAMSHIVARELLLHPDMQRFYVEEGKWVDFLAARVPEYAELQ